MEVTFKFLSENTTTTVHDINNMHSIKSEFCHSIISEIWAWPVDKNTWITAPYIPGRENYGSDAKSCKKQTELLERMLNQKLLQKLFLSFNYNQMWAYLNQGSMCNYQFAQCPTMHINTFSISWWYRPFYAFRPFAVIGKVLHKIVLDVATGIIVVPN